MGILGNIIVRLGVNTAQFTSGLAAAAASTNTFSRNLANSFQNTANASSIAGNAVSVFSNKTASGFKDVARIAQGIVVSQLFYQSVNSIRSATSALGEFSMQCEDARMSFGVLMKDQAKADRFMNTVQDFAARTPFTMQQSVEQARKLLAYGFKSDNMTPIMSTLADASAASGDAQTFERVGRALGQIRTKGKMASQELLQLTEAGIPAFEILREKLHLTQDEMGKIGKLGISGDVAVNAILKGMQERYGGAAAAMAETTRGMLSTIKDNMLIIGSEATAPIYNSFKNTIRKMRNALDEMRATVREGGIGGLLQQLIPSEAFTKVQLLAANFIGLRDNISLLMKALAPFASAVLEFIVNALNLALPMISAVSRGLAMLAYVISQCSPFVRNFVGAIMGLLVIGGVIQLLAGFIGMLKGLFIVRLIAQLVIGLAQAIRLLAIAMMTNPLIAMLGVAAGAILYFGMASKKVSGWIDGLGGGISKAFGTDPSKVFKPKMKENNEQAGEFNKNLTLSKDKLDNMGKAAKKAGDKAKDMLMSFDEVFNIKNQDENGDNPDAGDISDIGDIGTPEIPAIGVPDIEYPDTTDGISGWLNKFVDNFKSIAARILAGAGLGAVIGGLLAAALFGPGGIFAGMLLGAGIGALVAAFWDTFTKEMQRTILGLSLGSAIGGLLGLALFGPGGILPGMAIGAGIGYIVSQFWYSFSTTMKNVILGMGIGGIIGGVLGVALFGPAGILPGMQIGAGIGAIVGYFCEEFIKQWNANEIKPTDVMSFFEKLKQVLIATATIKMDEFGAWITVLPEKVNIWFNQALDNMSKYISDGIRNYFTSCTTDLLASLSELWSGVFNNFAEAFSGDKSILEIGGWIVKGILAGIGAAVSTIFEPLYAYLINPMINAIKELFGIHSPATTMYPVGQYLVEGIFEGIKGAFSWFIESIASFGGVVVDAFKVWWTGLGADITEWANSTESTLQGWWNNITLGFSSWVDNTKAAIGNWWSDTKNSFNTWCDSTSTSFNNWWTKNKAGFITWFSDIKNGLSTWSTNAYNNIIAWAKNSSSQFEDWFSSNAKSFVSWWSNNITGFSTWSSDILNSLSNWFNYTCAKFKDWFNVNRTGFSIWFYNVISNLGTWTSNFISKVGSWYNDTSSKFKSWWLDIITGFNTWSSNVISKIGSWYTDTSSKFKSWWSENTTGFSTWSSAIINSVGTWCTDIISKVGAWCNDTSSKFKAWWSESTSGFSTWSSTVISNIGTWCTDVASKIGSWYTDTSSKFKSWWSENTSGFSTWSSAVIDSIGTWCTEAASKINTWISESLDAIKGWWSDTSTGFSEWAKGCFDEVSDWFGKISDKIGKVIDKVKDLAKSKLGIGSADDEDYDEDEDEDDGDNLRGHATGGIFNKEHIAHFAEGNKAEAIIPLENAGAMQPFVDAIAGGLEQSLGGILSASIRTGNNSQDDNRQIMYVGTLIADDSGLKELDRRMRVITIQENQRRGINVEQ